MGKYKKNLIFVAVSIAALAFYIIFFEGVGEFIALFHTMRWNWLFAGLGCLAAYLLLEGGILHLMTRQLDARQSFGQSMRVALIGQFFNCITPCASGGQPMQAYEMHKNGVNLGTATTALVGKFIVYQLVLTGYTLAILISKIGFFQANVAAFSYLAILGFLINLGVALGLLGIAFFPRKVEKFCLWLGRLLTRMKLMKHYDAYEAKVADTVDTFYHDFQRLHRNIPLLFQSAVLTVVQLTFFLLIPFTICRSLGVEGFDVITVMSAAAFVMMISAFVPIPGTIGAAEGTFYIFFSLFFPSNIIYMAILFWRLYTFYFPILIGGVSTLLPRAKQRLTAVTHS